MNINYFILLYILKTSYAQNSIVDEYVKNITEYQNQILTWTYPTNSNSYLGEHFNPRVHIDDGEYDFIICGAGSTGSVLANRLSEVSQWKILLIEAGTWENNITDIPSLAPTLRTTNFNWGYLTTPQKYGMNGYIDSEIYIPRGKALGGSSVNNAMIYSRGNKADFDSWGEHNPGWSYEEILPYFQKSEHVNFPNYDQGYHGRNGTLNVEYSSVFDEVGQAFLDANKGLGRKILDYNGANEMGFSIIQLNEINGKRDSASKAFLTPARNRPNLHIMSETLVTKLLIDHETKQVYGVQYLRNGTQHFAIARKEVILSAGAVNTPQILMLSGIGPREHLKSLGISVVQDSPVGENLWDHALYTYQSFETNHSYVNPSLEVQVEQYLNGSGPLTATYELQIIGFVNVNNTTSEIPDIEYMFHSNKEDPESYEYYKQMERYTEDTYTNVVKPIEGKNQWTLDTIMIHPKSRGTVRLKSASPLDYPILDPNYFSDPQDADTLATAIGNVVFQMAESESMQKYNSTPIKVCHPLCNCSDYGTHDFWKCMVINLSNSIYHLGGTAKMGPIHDKSSVVDNYLRLYGITGLRIADCSIIPVPLSGHTNAAAYMIGEKASDLIKQNYCNDKC